MATSRKINSPKLLVYDFDGVMTDNRVLVFEDGREAVFCNRSDGLAIAKIAEMGITQMILSTEKNPVVLARAKKLKLEAISGCEDKKTTLARFLSDHGYVGSEVGYLGNDLNDLEAMRLCGLKICPSDAAKEIQDISDWITNAKGGEGMIREVFDWLVSHPLEYTS